jgi:hypothetical protein
MTMRIHFADAGFRGSVAVRDVWEHKDLGTMRDWFEIFVPKHQSVLVTLKSATKWRQPGCAWSIAAPESLCRRAH